LKNGCLADFSEMMNFFGVKLKAQKGVLVVSPDFATIRVPGPFQAFRPRHSA
jgi:hypothetical protein